eukprot:gene41128-30669_t
MGDAMSAAESDPDIEIPLKTRIHMLFEDPNSSTCAMYVSSFFLFLIMLSTIAFMLETLPALSPDPEFGDPEKFKPFWIWLETTFQGMYDKRDNKFYVTDVQGHRVESSF